MKLIFNIYPRTNAFGQDLDEIELLRQKKAIEEKLKALRVKRR